MKKSFLLMALCLLCLLLSGCSLAAAPDPDIEPQGDTFAGVFVNLQSTADASTPPFGNAEADDEGRIYATKTQANYTSEDSGLSQKSVEYDFSHVQGCGMFMYKRAGSGSIFSSSGKTSMLSDLKYGVVSTDDENSDTIDVTVYLTPSFSGVMHFAEIYADSEGDLYISPDVESIPVSSQMAGYKKALSHEITTISDGKEMPTLFTCTVNLDVATPTQSLTLVQMSGDNTVIARDSFEVRALASELAVSSETEYIIATTISLAPDGSKQTAREILTGLDSSYSFYYESEGICLPNAIFLNWEK